MDTIGIGKIGVDERPVPGRKGNKAADAKPENAAHAAIAGAAGKAPPATAKALSPAAAKIATQKVMAELVLNATLLYGEQRIAMINGRAYRTGEPLAASDSATQLRVAEIHHHRVVLENDGRLVDLTYSDKPAGTKPGRSAQVAGRPAKTKSVKTAAKTRQPRPPSPAVPPAPQAR